MNVKGVHVFGLWALVFLLNTLSSSMIFHQECRVLCHNGESISKQELPQKLHYKGLSSKGGPALWGKRLDITFSQLIVSSRYAMSALTMMQGAINSLLYKGEDVFVMPPSGDMVH